jgi:death-on-curing protein
VIFLSPAELVYVAERATVGKVAVRDHGLLASAAARPRATVSGQDAYPGIEDKAAALFHSLARNHPLIDGNKRLALAGLIAFLGVNGCKLTLTNEEAYDLTMAVAAGEIDDVAAIAARIKGAIVAR